MTAEHRMPGGGPGGPAGGPEEARRRAEATAAAERRIADRFARLHAATAALSAAVTRTEVAAAIASRGAALPGACGCAVAIEVTPAGPLVVAASRGTADPPIAGTEAVPRGADHPLAVAARERCAVFTGGDPARARDLVAAGFPAPAALVRPVAALPLDTGGEVLGAVAVTFQEPIVFDEEERAFLGAFAHQCAQALDRARLYEAEREARLEAQRAEEAARHAVELQEQLVGIVGHDLRTPLAAIRMSVAVLFRRGGLGDEQARTLARVGASAARMSRIIHDLLDFTRVRREGAIPVVPRLGDVVAVVRRAVAEIAAVHPAREIALDVPAALHVPADPDRVAQVVTNLVGNALQHGPAEGTVTVTVREEAGAFTLDVHNDGPPIPEQLVPELFEPFRRGRRGGEGGSLGLGLFIVREIARAHGGEVAVRSGEGEGTTFTVRLPGLAGEPRPASWGRPAADR